MSALAPTLQAFFTERLTRQRRASGHTIAAKRADKAIVTWHTEQEADALLAAPDHATRTGRRDPDTHLGPGSHVTCHGKGRKQRVTPLTAPATAVLREWLKELPAGPAQILFPGPAGNRLSRDAVESRLSLRAATAAACCPSLAGKTITPHVCATQPPCDCTPVSKYRSSPCGSATSRPKQQGST